MDEKKIGKLRRAFTGNGLKNPKLDSKNPYDRYLELSDSNRVWRRIFLLTLATLIFSVSGNIFQAVNKKDRIIRVDVDKATGGVVETKVIKADSQADERQINYFLSKFILDVRSIPLDNNYYNGKIKEASYFLTLEAQNKLKKIIEEDKISEKFFNRETVNVKILSVNKITNVTGTYQIRWQETTFNDQGAETKKELFTSSLTIDFITPDSDEMTMVNPFGIVIKDLTISKEK